MDECQSGLAGGGRCPELGRDRLADLSAPVQRRHDGTTDRPSKPNTLPSYVVPRHWSEGYITLSTTRSRQHHSVKFHPYYAMVHEPTAQYVYLSLTYLFLYSSCSVTSVQTLLRFDFVVNIFPNMPIAASYRLLLPTYMSLTMDG